MPASQLRLFPDARPLVDCFGPEFFRQIPRAPGVYFMRDAAQALLYIGKARNLRQRLGSYRVANPERMPRRTVRLLARVRRIDWEECPDEAAALALERELILLNRPRFNRAGTWKAPARWLLWRENSGAFELALVDAPQPDWPGQMRLRSGGGWFYQALLQLIWCVLQPSRSLAAMPPGWLHGSLPGLVALRPDPTVSISPAELVTRLENWSKGNAAWLVEWLFQTATRSAQTAPWLECLQASAAYLSGQMAAAPSIHREAPEPARPVRMVQESLL